MRGLIAVRKRYQALGRGSLEFLSPDNQKVLVYLRHYEDEWLLIVANLSRFLQHVECDLSAFAGYRPVEVFGRTVFPAIETPLYRLTVPNNITMGGDEIVVYATPWTRYPLREPGPDAPAR